ncbi:hypothetical protein AAVH_40179 [Aphelenchoides avenae]|nr:hypothetical protein AAVH_40179 [Aphelenchus avenae]
MFPSVFSFLAAAVLPAISLKDCAFDEWRNGYGSDGYFPCAELGTAKNCSGRLLLVSINDGKADLSSVSTSRGRMNYDNQFASGFVRPGCRLRLWSEKAFNGE